MKYRGSCLFIIGVVSWLALCAGILLALMLVGVSRVHAQVEITEIMYALPGADTDREWIEISNTGPSDLAISDLKLYENDVHHRLQAYPDDAFSVLACGETAVIVQKPEAFLLEWQDRDAVIIDSSFSLHNTEEEIAITDSDENVLDVTRYTSSMGGLDTGGSLHRIGNDWQEGTPTPGESSVSSDCSNVGGADSSQAQSEIVSTSSYPRSSSLAFNTSQSPRKKAGPEYEMYLDIPAVIFSNIPVNIKTTIIEDGDKSVIGGYFRWSLGDGTYYEFKNAKDVLHTYQYPGSYYMYLEYYRTVFSEDPDAVYEQTVKVLEPKVVIGGIDDSGGIIIENTSSKPIDLARWSIVGDDASFTIPHRTIVGPHTSLTLPSLVTKFTRKDIGNEVSLYLPKQYSNELYDTGRIRDLDIPVDFLRYEPDESLPPVMASAWSPKPIETKSQQTEPPVVPIVRVAKAKAPSVQNSGSTPIDAPEAMPELSPQEIGVEESTKGNSIALIVLLGLGFLLVGVGMVIVGRKLYVQHYRSKGDEQEDPSEEYTILEA